MADEIPENSQQDEQGSKSERIKKRLKEMGVTEDSERPARGLLNRYGKFILPVALVVLVAAYGYEYSRQKDSQDQTVAQSQEADMSSQSHPYAYGHPMQRPEPPAWVKERQAQMQQRPEPPAWVKERQAQMQQRPEPPAWVQQRRAWMQQQMNMHHAPVNTAGDNTNGNANQGGANTNYAPRYQPAPHPYWQGQPGYYPGYGQWPTHAAPYGNSYPYYNGWQR